MWRNLLAWLDEATYPMVREIRVMAAVSASSPFVPEQHGSPAFRLSKWRTYEIDVDDAYQHEVTDYIVRDGLLYFTKPLAPGSWVTVFKS